MDEKPRGGRWQVLWRWGWWTATAFLVVILYLLSPVPAEYFIVKFEAPDWACEAEERLLVPARWVRSKTDLLYPVDEKLGVILRASFGPVDIAENAMRP